MTIADDRDGWSSFKQCHKRASNCSVSELQRPFVAYNHAAGTIQQHWQAGNS